MVRKLVLGMFIPILLLNEYSFQNIVHATEVSENTNLRDSKRIDVSYYFYEQEESIPVYNDANGSDTVYEVSHKSSIQLLEEFGEYDDYVFVRIYTAETNEVIDGYVSKTFIKENEETKPSKGYEKKVEADLNEENEELLIESRNDEEEKSNDELQDTNEIDDVEKEEATKNEFIDKKGHKIVTLSNKVKNYRGVAKKSPTNIRTKPSTKSKVLKKFPTGTVLDYQSYSDNWFQITIQANGKQEVGYLHKKHVTTVNTQPKDVKGVLKKSPTNIRAGASTKSKVIKKFPIGHVLEYKTFSKNWFEVKLDDSTKGYLHRKHVTNIKTKPKPTTKIALKKATNVRAGASIESKVLTKIPYGTIVNVESFSKNWYSYKVDVNGSIQTGYIHTKHIGDMAIKYTNYNLTFNQALNIQLEKLRIKSAPKTLMYVEKKALTKEKGKWVIKEKKNDWKVRSQPDPKSRAIGKIGKDKTDIIVDEKNSTKDYFKFTSSWIIPTIAETQSALDPRNVKNDSTEFYQFLVLSEPAGTKEDELNNKILSGKGILSGMGSVFINTANKHKINELYLISHAELETGNGTSVLSNGSLRVEELSKGIKFLVYNERTSKGYLAEHKNKAWEIKETSMSPSKNAVEIFNMFGIGAVDENANVFGAIRAYNERWTSPEKAILGGAEFIATKYITAGNSTFSGQDTLYKMRWHPEGMEKLGARSWHQYASDIHWAEKQVSKIKKYYDSLEEYVLKFDVPVYK